MRISDWSSDVCSSDLCIGESGSVEQDLVLDGGLCEVLAAFLLELGLLEPDTSSDNGASSPDLRMDMLVGCFEHLCTLSRGRDGAEPVKLTSEKKLTGSGSFAGWTCCAGCVHEIG